MLAQRCGGSVESVPEPKLRHFGSAESSSEPDACCATDLKAITSATQHASGSKGGSTESKWRHVGVTLDSSLLT